MSTARQITSLPRAGAVSLYDQFAIWQRGRTTICDVNDLLAFLQIGLRGPQGEPGPKGDKGDPGTTVIVTPGGDIDTATLNFPTLPDSDNGPKAANTNWVNKKLGKDVGITWGPSENRLLLQKSHSLSRTGVQPIFDMLLYGTNGSLDDSGGGVGLVHQVRAESLANTKYGIFASNAYMTNRSTYNENDPNDKFHGHVAFAPYIDIENLNGSPSWAIAAQVAENHKLANPPNIAYTAELAYFAAGTDNFNQRVMLFLPANQIPGGEGLGTAEFGKGIFWHTPGDAKYKNAMFLTGKYGNILNAVGVQADRLILATGAFGFPVIDLHAVGNVTGSAALAINQVHNIQWQNTAGSTLASIGWDTDIASLSFTGVKLEPGAGAPNGFLRVKVEGVAKRIQLFNDA